MTAKSSQPPPDSQPNVSHPVVHRAATVTTVAHGRTSERTADQAETALAHDGGLGWSATWCCLAC